MTMEIRSMVVSNAKLMRGDEPMKMSEISNTLKPPIDNRKLELLTNCRFRNCDSVPKSAWCVHASARQRPHLVCRIRQQALRP